MGMSRVGVLPASKAIRRVTVEPGPAALGLSGGGSRALQALAELSIKAL